MKLHVHSKDFNKEYAQGLNVFSNSHKKINYNFYKICHYKGKLNNHIYKNYFFLLSYRLNIVCSNA